MVLRIFSKDDNSKLKTATRFLLSGTLALIVASQVAMAETSLSKVDSRFLSIVRNFDSGERSSTAIQSELSTIAGDSDAISWKKNTLKGQYKLNKILTHVRDLDSGLELLHTYTFADGENDEAQSLHFTRNVHKSDEQSVGASIVFSRLIEIRDGTPIFDDTSRAQYSFFLNSDSSNNNFGLRTPEGAFKIESPTESTFDPLPKLDQLNDQFLQSGEYQFDLQENDKILSVTLTPRITDLKSLTIEISVRDINSLTTNTFVLVYEPSTQEPPAHVKVQSPQIEFPEEMPANELPFSKILLPKVI